MVKKVLMACSNNWNSPFQVGSHHIANEFIKSGWQVAFVSDPISPLHFLFPSDKNNILRDRFKVYKKHGLEEYDGKLWAYVPGTLLAPHNRMILKNDWVQSNWEKLTIPNVIRLVKQRGFGEVDLLYLDSLNQSFWLDHIGAKKSIYRLADNNRGFDKYTGASRKLEEKVAERVDHVFYTSRELKNYFEKDKVKQMSYLPNGVNYQHFQNVTDDLPEEFLSIPEPRIIYVGAIDVWFDFELMNYLVKNMPDVYFTLIGPSSLAKKLLKNSHNLFLLGKKEYASLPAYLSKSDLGIIPFNVRDYPDLVNSVNPLKMYEYLASGIDVVAPEWNAIKDLQAPIYFYNDVKQAEDCIRKILKDKSESQSLKGFAETFDWNHTFKDLMSQLLCF